MATVGSLGDVVFSVSKRRVKTITSVKWVSGARYSFHSRHLLKPLPEFQGPDTGTLSFDVTLSVFLGVVPSNEIRKLNQYVEEGRTLPFILGRKIMGSYRWVIDKASKDLERFDKKGNLVAARVSLSLKEYPRR